ncbi:MAG: alpha/beta hydrolase [Chitinophagales bacterium]
MSRFIRYIPLVAGQALAVWWGIGWYYAWKMTQNGNRDISDFDHIDEFPLQDITITTRDGVDVSAWFIENNSDKVVIILSGRGSNRHHSIGKARFYLKKGYSVLLPDLRGTGRSTGEAISFGWHERNDFIACFNYLKAKGYHQIGAHGFSAGAATIAYSLKKVKGLKFIVLESCYASLYRTINYTMHANYLPERFAYPMKFFTQKYTGIKFKVMMPERYIQYAEAPVLVMSGDSELLVKTSDTMSLYENALNATFRKVHIFETGKHEHFINRFYPEYTKLMEDFIGQVEQEHQGRASASS